MFLSERDQQRLRPHGRYGWLDQVGKVYLPGGMSSRMSGLEFRARIWLARQFVHLAELFHWLGESVLPEECRRRPRM